MQRECRYGQSVRKERKGDSLLFVRGPVFLLQIVVCCTCPLGHPGTSQNEDEGPYITYSLELGGFGTKTHGENSLALSLLSHSYCSRNSKEITNSLALTRKTFICCTLRHEQGRVQILVGTEAGKGAKSSFLWRPSVSLSPHAQEKLQSAERWECIIIRVTEKGAQVW